VPRAVDVHVPGEFPALFLSPTLRSATLCLCSPDEGDNLALALQARRQFGADAPRIVVPATAWSFRMRDLFGRAASGITPVFYSTRATSLDLLRDSALEATARAVHRAYLETRRLAPDFGERPADVAWQELPEPYRESARRNVDEMVAQLQAVWYELEPRYDWDLPLVVLPAAEVDLLAQLEHERWCRERRASGWEYGSERDLQARPPRHPLLVQWSALDEREREIDRELARQRPAILARAGYQIVRSAEREQLARLLHARLAAVRSGAGSAGSQSPVAWELLDTEARELNLSAVDDIARKLLRIGLRMVPARDGAPLKLRAEQIDLLAREEHLRWCEARRAQGWGYGPERDESRKLHPDLVSWEDLAEPRRELDRELVRALPEALRAVGRGVVALDDPDPARSGLPLHPGLQER
jgi:hypothetical protein